MKCHEWQAHWQAVLDGDASSGDRADWLAHARDCSTCRELQAIAARVEKALRHAPEPVAPPRFADRVLTAVRHDQRRARRQRWIGVTTGLAAAAALVWGSVVLFFLNKDARRGLSPPTREVAQPGKAPGRAAVEPNAAPVSLEAQVADAGSATMDLTRQMARDTLRQASLFVPPASSASQLRRPGSWQDSAFLPRAVPVGQVTQSFADSLEPVTTSTRRAFDLFWQLLPPTDIEKL